MPRQKLLSINLATLKLRGVPPSPTTANPSRRNSSASPKQRQLQPIAGKIRPATSSARLTISASAEVLTDKHSASFAIPPFPGAHQIFLHPRALLQFPNKRMLPPPAANHKYPHHPPPRPSARVCQRNIRSPFSPPSAKTQDKRTSPLAVNNRTPEISKTTKSLYV